MINYTVRYTAKLKEVLVQQTTGHVPYIPPVAAFVVIGAERFKVIGVLYAPQLSHIEVVLE